MSGRAGISRRNLFISNVLLDCSYVLTRGRCCCCCCCCCCVTVRQTHRQTDRRTSRQTDRQTTLSFYPKRAVMCAKNWLLLSDFYQAPLQLCVSLSFQNSARDFLGNKRCVFPRIYRTGLRGSEARRGRGSPGCCSQHTGRC